MVGTTVSRGGAGAHAGCRGGICGVGVPVGACVEWVGKWGMLMSVGACYVVWDDCRRVWGGLGNVVAGVCYVAWDGC